MEEARRLYRTCHRPPTYRNVTQLFCLILNKLFLLCCHRLSYQTCSHKSYISMLLRFMLFTCKICLAWHAAVTLSQAHDYETAGVISSKQKQVGFDTRHVYIPAFPLYFSDAECSQDIDSNAYLVRLLKSGWEYHYWIEQTFDFSTRNGALFANNVSIFPSSLPMQLNAVRHWHSGHQNVSLAYDLHAWSIPSGPDELVGYMFILKLRFSDLHGRPASDSMISITFNQGSGGNFIISQVETDLI